MRHSRTTRVLLARHGQTVTNTTNVFCGHAETELTDLGRRQAAALGERLATTAIDACYTSDYARTQLTAAIVLAGRALPSSGEVAADCDLRELHYGLWELQKGRAMARAYPEQYALMRKGDPAWQPPGGETILQVRARMLRAFRRMVHRHPGQTVLVVSHGTALNCLFAGLLEMDPAATFRLEVTNCALSEVTARPGAPAQVARLNDVSHLERDGLLGKAHR